MMKHIPLHLLSLSFFTLVASPALADGIVSSQWKWLTFLVFSFIICATLCVTYIAARRIKNAQDFYTAGGRISGLQNGWAIAGDYLSAASFLGIAGLISLYGYDGFMYSVGFLCAYIAVMLLIAEPCRNIGKYTLADILAYRNNPRTIRAVSSLSVITVSTFYLIAQMVGGGVLIKNLIGIEYEVSVVAVGILMLVYVIFGGMVATTWVQIIKAILLVSSSFLLVVLVWAPYGFSLPGFLDAVVSNKAVQDQVAKLLGNTASSMTPEQLGQRFLEPGLFFKDPLDQISLGIALVFGTAGLPHILMRFFTVPTAQDARTSVIWAMAIIGGFYLLTFFLGMSAAMHVGPAAIFSIDKGGNMAAPLLAQYVGGGADSLLGNLFLAFVAAVAFATIVAVVAGLVLASASAVAHDIYVGIIRGGDASHKEQITAARIATIVVGCIAILLGILSKGQNVAHLVGLAFAVAASANFPCILLTLFWEKCNTGGIVAGMIVGTFTAIALVLVSPNMTYPKAVKASASLTLHGDPAKMVLPVADKILAVETHIASESNPENKKTLMAQLKQLKSSEQKANEDFEKFKDTDVSIVGLESPLFPLKNPGIISVPLGFLAIFLGSLLYRSDRRARDKWKELYVKQNTGIGIAEAVSH